MSGESIAAFLGTYGVGLLAVGLLTLLLRRRRRRDQGDE